MGRRNRINILLTSVGKRVELVRAFRTAYTGLELEGDIVATDIDPLAPALKLANKKWIVPRVNSVDYIPSLLEICRKEEVDCIFPLIDPDIPVLARHKEALEATGAKLAVVSSEASDICNDKWLTTQFFQHLNLFTPRSWLPKDFKFGDAPFPLFIKPRNGSASAHTYRINNEQEYSFFVDYVPNPIVQEFINGPEITNDIVCDVTGEILGIISRKRIEVRSGEVSKGVTIFDNNIMNSCLRISKELPAIGPITVQCILQNDKTYFTEINARLGGGIPLGIAAGANSPLWLLARAAEIPIEIPPIGSYETGLFMTRYDDSFFLREADFVKMGSSHF